MEDRTVRSFKNYALRLCEGYNRGYGFFRSLSVEHEEFWQRINCLRDFKLREQRLSVPDEIDDEAWFDQQNPVELTLGEWQTLKEALRELIFKQINQQPKEDRHDAYQL